MGKVGEKKRKCSSKKALGYVYILTNQWLKKNVIKIGRTSRPVNIRSRDLYNTSMPDKFEEYASLKTSKYVEAEKLIHYICTKLTNKRINEKREFFRMAPKLALDIFREVAKIIDDAEVAVVSDGNGKELMHNATSDRKIKKQINNNQVVSESQYKIGDVAKIVFPYIFEHGLVDEKDIKYLLSDSAIKYFKTAGHHIIMLSKGVPNEHKDDKGRGRFYSKIILKFKSRKYLLSSQWYDKAFTPLMQWLKEHGLRANDIKNICNKVYKAKRM